MNNKGFMMAEVVVVASIVLVTMVGLYTSYNKIFSLYNQRVNYYDVATLYELGTFKESHLPKETGNVPITLSDDVFEDDNIYNRTIYYVTMNQLKNFDEDNTLIDTDKQNTTFNDYINYLSTSIMFDNADYNDVKNFLVIEKCEKEKEDNCKYAYLEVYEIEVETQ